MDAERGRYLVPVCFPISAALRFTSLGGFTIHSILILFCFQCRFSFSALQGLQFYVESAPGLDVPFLRLLEVDDIPDGIEVLQT